MAKISKGRTIKQYLFGAIILPTLYCFLFPVVFGGVGIRLERESSSIGLCCKEETGWFHSYTHLLEAAKSRNILQDIMQKKSSDMAWMCNGDCSSCAESTIISRAKLNKTYVDFIREYELLGEDFGSVSLDRTISRPSCHAPEKAWFDVIRSMSGIGQILSPFSLLVMLIYFVTSADSGSLVITCLAANGESDSASIQRAFWAIMLGVTATALLTAGGSASLISVQTMSILCACPFAVLICILCVSTWRVLKVTSGELKPCGHQFAFGLFEPFGGAPYKR